MPHLSLVHNNDDGSVSITSIVSVTGKKSIFHQSNSLPDIKFFDNLIGWMLANTGKATLEKKLSQSVTLTLATLRWLQRHIVNPALLGQVGDVLVFR